MVHLFPIKVCLNKSCLPLFGNVKIRGNFASLNKFEFLDNKWKYDQKRVTSRFTKRTPSLFDFDRFLTEFR